MKNLVMYNLNSQTICMYRLWNYVLYPAKQIDKLCEGVKVKTVIKMELNINLN